MFRYFFPGEKEPAPASDSGHSSIEMSTPIGSDWVLVEGPGFVGEEPGYVEENSHSHYVQEGSDYAEDKPYEVYNINPDGDVVIVLTRSISCDDYISWPEQREDDLSITFEDAPALDEWLELVVPDTSAVDCASGKEPLDDESEKGSQGLIDVGESPTLMGSSATKSSVSSENTWSTDSVDLPAQNSTSKVPQGTYQFLVSSSHLMAASPVFKNMLNNGGGLGRLHHADGKIYFTARGVNEEALRILLKILSLRTGGLPPTLELSCLCILSVLAFQLKCVHAVQYFGEQWCEKAERKYDVSREVGHINLMWLCTSYVFQRSLRLKEAAHKFLYFSKTDVLPTLGLPIEPVMVTIYAKRTGTLKAAIDFIFEYKDKYSDLEYVCQADKKYSDICGAVMEGCISQGLRKIGVVKRDTPMTTFDGLSVQMLCAQVFALEVPKWKTHDKRTHKCDFEQMQKDFIPCVQEQMFLGNIGGDPDLD